MYLLAMPAASFSVYYVWPKVNVPNDAAQTAINIMAAERLFRVSIVTDVMTWVIDIVLILALYVLLKPVNRHIALLGVFFRIVETAILSVITLGGVVALIVLNRPDYLAVFETSQLQALARLALGASGAGYDFGLIFLGFGTAVFSYLLYKSGYVPRVFGAWGVFSSLVLLTGGLALIVFPEWRAALMPAYFAPIFLYELALGFWLLIKGARLESGPSKA